MPDLDISIVIPSRRREVLLADLLLALAEQQDPPGFEVVVVEDEPDATYALPAVPFPLKHLTGGGRGPAHARNVGVKAAEGRWILFLDDDVVPADPAFLTRMHGILRTLPDRTGVLGRVDWAPEIPLNAFRWWLDHGGPQFAFFRLEHNRSVPGRFVATACFALPREIALTFPFDETFPYPAYEDWDLGLRLEAAGISVLYREDLRVLHRSAPTLEAYLRRASFVGWSRRRLVHKHPGVRTFPERVPGGIFAGWLVFEGLGRLLFPLARRAEHLSPAWTPWVGWLFAAAYRRAFFRGYRRGRHGPPP